MIRRTLLSLLVSFVVTGVVLYMALVRPRVQHWGVDPAESSDALPGDDVVPEPTVSDTRGISINATPAQIWPWLLQMGYDRAGWYSYDGLDNTGPSAESILPQYQHLAAGDIVPTHPGGGFRVEHVESEQALVLSIDSEMVKAQAGEATTEGTAEMPSAGLKLTGKLSGAGLSEFRASWAFVLKPLDDGRTRLVERTRVWTPGLTGVPRASLSVFGMGVFVMTRRQMLGIKERAERLAGGPTPLPVAA
jgi:hypothetical protein